MPLLPAGALGGGRSVAPVGPGRMGIRLPPAACEQFEQEQDDVAQESAGDQTGRNADKRQSGGGSSRSSRGLGPIPTPARGRRSTSSLGSSPSPASVKRFGSKVRFRSVESVREITPCSKAPSSAPQSPGDGFDPTGARADCPIDPNSPFFGGSAMQLALAGEAMLRSA